MTARRRRMTRVAAAAALATGCATALAQAPYPTRTIRLVVPFAPGGVVDAVGRIWADKVGPGLGTIIVDNRSGAGGVIGAGEVARSEPDGHTLLLGNSSTQILTPAVMSKPPYNGVRDFVAVDMVAVSATSIVVHPSLPARDLKQLISYAKANPGKLSYGSAGAGTLTNLAGEMFKQLGGGLDIVHVPYKGAGPGITDLIGGFIPIMTPNITAQVLSLHQAGKLRVVAVNAPQRLKAAPDVPAAVESIPGMVVELFNGVFAPARTPKHVVDRVSQATRRALTEPAFQKILSQSGFEPVLVSSPEQAQRHVEREHERFIPIIKKLGFRLD